MKRDMDFVRSLLLQIEGGAYVFKTLSNEVAECLGMAPEQSMLSEDEAKKLDGHLKLLEQAGFIEVQSRNLGGLVCVKAITWDGYEFLETVRDEEIWSKTKIHAKKAGIWALDIIVGLAKEVAKSELKKRTGLSIE